MKKLSLFLVLAMLVSIFAFTATAEGVTYSQAPMLDAAVQAGDLPPVEERLPETPKVAHEILDEYLEYRKTLIGERDRSEGKLLLRNSKKKGTPMDFNSVGYAVKKLAKKAEVRASCHTLRRLFCTNLAEDNPLEVVKANMRHSFASTTVDHYLTARPVQKKKAANRAADKLFN